MDIACYTYCDPTNTVDFRLLVNAIEQQTLQDMQKKQKTTTAPAVSPVTTDYEYTTPNYLETDI